jgi:hypothetical protein
LGFANEAPAEGQEAKPELITKMQDGIKGLSEKAKKADTLTTELANEKTARTADVTKLKGERDTAKTEFANERTARIADLLGAAIKDGRITAAEKADWERRLGTDFANESVALGKLTAKVKTASFANTRVSRVDAASATSVAEVAALIDAEESKLPANVKNRRAVAFANAQKAHPEKFKSEPSED